MKSVVFLSLMIFFIALPKYSQQTFWRRVKPTLPSDPNSKVYQKFQTIPTPQETAQSILKNFVGYHGGIRGKREDSKVINEDIIVVLDASGSIGSCEFGEGKRAMAEMMKTCPEKGPKYSCLYSAISYSSSATEVFRSLPLTQAAPIMRGIHYPGGGSNTAAALDVAAKIVRSVTVKRALAQRKVLLVTDGQSNNKQATIDSAKRLKNMSGVEIYVVAVGQYINGIDEMVKVATYPPEFKVFRVKKVSDLKYVIELALQKMNPSKYTAVKPPKPLCS